MKKSKKIFLSITAFGLIVAMIVIFSNPLRRADDAVHSWLLNKVPVGSDIEYLLSVANQSGWEIEGMWEGNRPELHSDWGGIDGAKVVWIYLGGYRNIFRTDLDSFWAFDETGHLVDVKTRRMMDAP